MCVPGCVAPEHEFTSMPFCSPLSLPPHFPQCLLSLLHIISSIIPFQALPIALPSATSSLVLHHHPASYCFGYRQLYAFALPSFALLLVPSCHFASRSRFVSSFSILGCSVFSFFPSVLTQSGKQHFTGLFEVARLKILEYLNLVIVSRNETVMGGCDCGWMLG